MRQADIFTYGQPFPDIGGGINPQCITVVITAFHDTFLVEITPGYSKVGFFGSVQNGKLVA